MTYEEFLDEVTTRTSFQLLILAQSRIQTV